MHKIMLIIKNNFELCRKKMIEKYTNKNNNHFNLFDVTNLFDEIYQLICNAKNVKYYIFDNDCDIAMLIIVKNQNAYNYYVIDDDFEIISLNKIELIELLIELIDDNIEML